MKELEEISFGVLKYAGVLESHDPNLKEDVFLCTCCWKPTPTKNVNKDLSSISIENDLDHKDDCPYMLAYNYYSKPRS